MFFMSLFFIFAIFAAPVGMAFFVVWPLVMFKNHLSDWNKVFYPAYIFSFFYLNWNITEDVWFHETVQYFSQLF